MTSCERTKLRAEHADARSKRQRADVPVIAGQGAKFTIYKDWMDGRGHVKGGPRMCPNDTIAQAIYFFVWPA